MPSATPSPEPSPTPPASLLAFVRVTENQAANIVLYDTMQGTEETLTRFAEPLNMGDVTWSQDGQWLVFVSAHDFIHSRNNERNVFAVRPDGTDLHMITGEHIDPDEAPGPYALLRGQVIGGGGPCLVCAQGAYPVTTDEKGYFELPGVPTSAKWARAVCQHGERVLQGDVDLAPLDEGLLPVAIVVEPQGQGWSQASLSMDGHRLAGTVYHWMLDEEERQYGYEGALSDWEGRRLGQLDLPSETTLIGLAWSPKEDRLVGALTEEKGSSLWLWDAVGVSLGPLVEILNPEDTILSTAHPAWSPDGSEVVFELRHWYWWGEHKYRTDLMIVSAKGDELRTLVEADWGTHASDPSWAADGTTVFYQLSTGEPGDDYRQKMNGDIWSVSVFEPTPTPWTQDGASYLPAARPLAPR